MIRHIWSVLCRSSSIDRDSNSLSIFDIAEELTLLEPLNEKGLAPFPIQLITLWGRSDWSQPAKDTVRIELLLPNGEKAGKPVEIQVDLTQHERLRNRLTIPAIPIVAEGVAEFIVQVREGDVWREVSRVPFAIKTELDRTSSPHSS